MKKIRTTWRVREPRTDKYQHFEDGDQIRSDQNSRMHHYHGHVRLRISREASSLFLILRGAAQRKGGSADIRIAEIAKIHDEEFLLAAHVVFLIPNGLVAIIDNGK